ncbi:hypothetical protein BKA93DRAFT_825299 [Sparassis latifolia]
MSSSIASVQPSASAEAPTATKSNNTPIAIGVSIGVVTFLTLLGIGYWTLRRRRFHAPVHGFHRHTSSVVDPSDLACRVTPFGSPGGEQPRFAHNPGENMRVAHRRSDGGWEFSDVEQDPLTPADFTPPPRLSGSTRSSLSPSAKDKLKPGELTTRGFAELDADNNPPPAYHAECSSLSEYQECFR